MTLKEFWQEHSYWSQKTFGPDIQRGPIGPLKHLAKEVQECIRNPDDLEEYADLIFLVFDSCRRAGFTYSDLEAAVTFKLAKNKKRKWNIPTSDEPVEHIRHESQSTHSNSKDEPTR